MQLDECLDNMLSSAHVMTAVVNDVLEVSKLEADRVEVLVRVADLENLRLGASQSCYLSEIGICYIFTSPNP